MPYLLHIHCKMRCLLVFICPAWKNFRSIYSIYDPAEMFFASYIGSHIPDCHSFFVLLILIWCCTVFWILVVVTILFCKATIVCVWKIYPLNDFYLCVLSVHLFNLCTSCCLLVWLFCLLYLTLNGCICWLHHSNSEPCFFGCWQWDIHNAH